MPGPQGITQNPAAPRFDWSGSDIGTCPAGPELTQGDRLRLMAAIDELLLPWRMDLVLRQACPADLEWSGSSCNPVRHHDSAQRRRQHPAVELRRRETSDQISAGIKLPQAGVGADHPRPPGAAITSQQLGHTIADHKRHRRSAMVGATGAVLLQTAAEFTHREQGHRRAIRQQIETRRQGREGGRQLGQQALMPRGLIGMGVVTALGELQHRRALPPGDQLQRQPHLLPQTSPWQLETWWQRRQSRAQPLQMALALQLERQQLPQHRMGASPFGIELGRGSGRELGGIKLQRQGAATLQGRAAGGAEGQQRPRVLALIEGGRQPARTFTAGIGGGPLIRRLEMAAVGPGC